MWETDIDAENRKSFSKLSEKPEKFLISMGKQASITSFFSLYKHSAFKNWLFYSCHIPSKNPLHISEKSSNQRPAPASFPRSQND